MRREEKTLDEALLTAIEASFEIDSFNPILQEAFEYRAEMLPAHAEKQGNTRDSD